MKKKVLSIYHLTHNRIEIDLNLIEYLDGVLDIPTNVFTLFHDKFIFKKGSLHFYEINYISGVSC